MILDFGEERLDVGLEVVVIAASISKVMTNQITGHPLVCALH